MKPFHVLNGDCLAEQLVLSNINHDIIVCRECLIEGEAMANNLDDFWKVRAKFISETHYASTEEYFNKTVREFEKLNHIPDHSEVCLWFENDLFCQVNMWFVISLLARRPPLKVYRVFPIIENEKDTWRGFGIADVKILEQAFDSRIQFTSHDLGLGKKLWEAYQRNDFEKLKELSKSPSDCFQFLEEVCQAHIDRFPIDNTPGRPEKVIKEILRSGTTEFQDVFSEFASCEGIYGFSDLQVKNIYNRHLFN